MENTKKYTTLEEVKEDIKDIIDRLNLKEGYVSLNGKIVYDVVTSVLKIADGLEIDREPQEKKLTLEDGKTYKTREGKFVIVTKQDHESYPFKGCINGKFFATYTKHGFCYESEKANEHDLVEEVVKEVTKLNLEKGKTYKTRNGKLVLITEKRNDYFIGTFYCNKTNYSYTTDGFFYDDKSFSQHDLIEEVPQLNLEVSKHYHNFNGDTYEITGKSQSNEFPFIGYCAKDEVIDLFDKSGIARLTENLIEEVKTSENKSESTEQESFEEVVSDILKILKDIIE